MLYEQLVHDMMDAQTKDGLVPDIAPELVVFKFGFRDSPEWVSAAILLPLRLYKWYGDNAIVCDAYPMMKRYLAYLETKSDNHILPHGLGDWYDYGPGFTGEAQLGNKMLLSNYKLISLSLFAGKSFFAGAEKDM